VASYLDEVAAQAAKEDATVLLWEVAQAFDEAPADAPCRQHPKARELHELIQFAKFDLLAPWLHERRDATQRACDFARRSGLAPLADRLQAALDAGHGDDLEISELMEGYDQALLQALLAARGQFELQPSRAVQARMDDDARIEGQSSAGAAALFRKLVSAPQPRMEAGSWEAFEARDTSKAHSLALSHRCWPAAAPAELEAQRRKYGAVASELLSVHALHDGAELFVRDGACGFELASIAQWDSALAEATQWAENVTWNGEHEEIPHWLYTAIAFGVTPGDHEHWLLITEGPHAGCVMLSDTDVIDDKPRYASFTQFMATLLDDAARVLNVAGHVRYLVPGDEDVFPVRYRYD
jgi:hypothetical protein